MKFATPAPLSAPPQEAVGGVAILESRWRRPGLGVGNVIGRGLLGRFAAEAAHWAVEWQNGTGASGTSDTLEALEHCRVNLVGEFPQGGMIGYVSYEFGHAILGLRSPGQPPYPLIQFLLYEQLGSKSSERSAKRSGIQVPSDRPSLDGWTPLMAKSEYRDAVRKIKEHIAEGDIYQANLTQAFETETSTHGREIYERLAQTNPAPFTAYLRFPPGRIPSGGAQRNFPGIEVISCSPERFWRKEGDLVETRPIKGTRARGRDSLSDRANLRALLQSAKDRAELLMITDLERNDLGKIADIGSVHVAALRRPRAYASVWHLESIVRARLAPGFRWHDVMRAMHPCGSITGAPKRRSVEILNEVESAPRGVYCGAIGWVNAAGDADFSVAIRTAVKIGTTLRVHGGGGIVADSDCDAEYEESLVKIAPMLDSLLPGRAEAGTYDTAIETSAVESR